MRINAGNLKKGHYISLDGDIWVALKSDHNFRGRGAAFLKTKIKNIKTKVTVDRNFRGDDLVEVVEVDTISLQYLYADNQDLYFMNNQTYEQFNIDKELVGDLTGYLKEGQTIHVTFHDGQPLTIVPPKNVVLKVTEAEVADKGDTTGNARKIVTLETGVKIKVPLFIKQGEEIIVSPETGEYVERA
ncbi:elongation factor P [Candidatus Roizmanbacteria bacterium RIFCSPHIGHO2_01_FULL_39_12b]|uniref:Elongation factor P n=1 Tax=Candidatus Roizmanbacteria bacterium RIFCSPHIGHO2_01_FULL_39_12b TaxID=1802030 RepID=A0A1F7GBF4_9BACT|nr:MAG: elongation factor P [Candidatus Roizmanbacteria bacterium RIFCSPHIGHO2_01_FULL_39_12b]OGK46118.1 MAG: elongation factor P [Candidatus Roizmanbacteria bacterium RIFCSPLOWO2_01_FULL_39_19]